MTRFNFGYKKAFFIKARFRSDGLTRAILPACDLPARRDQFGKYAT